MNRPLVSVIIPCYNAARWVGEAIESCLAQSYRPLEIILVDDGSTDGSGEILRRYASRHADFIQAMDQPHRGAPAARNRGLAMSRGEWVQWLDADDLLLPGKIELQMATLETRPWDAVVGGWRELREVAPGVWREGPLRQADGGDDTVMALIRDGGWAPLGSWLFRRSVIEAIGGWAESRPCMQDVDLVIRAAMSGARITYVSAPCAFYRRPLRPTLSTQDRGTFMRQCCSIYDDVGRFWSGKGWTEERRRTLCRCYGWVARTAFEHDRDLFDDCLARIRSLQRNYVPEGPPALRRLTRIVGYRNAEQVALWYRRAKARLSRGRKPAPSALREQGRAPKGDPIHTPAGLMRPPHRKTSVHAVELLARAVRRAPFIRDRENVWRVLRPAYDRLAVSLYPRGITWVVNGTERLVLSPTLRTVAAEHEPEAWRALMAEVREGDVFADVGANVGLFAIPVAKRLGDGGHVFAFEPDPHNAQLLETHVQLNQVARVTTVVRCAAGDRVGRLSFWCGRGPRSRAAWDGGDGAVAVECVTLDDYFAHRWVDLVKIDVEGCEERVIEGGMDLLRDPGRRPRAVFFETHPDLWPTGYTMASLNQRLASCGYDIFDMDGRPTSGGRRATMLVARPRLGRERLETVEQ